MCKKEQERFASIREKRLSLGTVQVHLQCHPLFYNFQRFTRTPEQGTAFALHFIATQEHDK